MERVSLETQSFSEELKNNMYVETTPNTAKGKRTIFPYEDYVVNTHPDLIMPLPPGPRFVHEGILGHFVSYFYLQVTCVSYCPSHVPALQALPLVVEALPD